MQSSLVETENGHCSCTDTYNSPSYFERSFYKIYSYTTIMLNCYCQVLLFLDNMVLANQNAKLTGSDQGFLVFPFVLTRKPWERGCLALFTSGQKQNGFPYRSGYKRANFCTKRTCRFAKQKNATKFNFF